MSSFATCQVDSVNRGLHSEGALSQCLTKVEVDFKRLLTILSNESRNSNKFDGEFITKLQFEKRSQKAKKRELY